MQTPAPWKHEECSGLVWNDKQSIVVVEADSPDDAELIVRLRNGYEIMLRRGWGVEFDAGDKTKGWVVYEKNSCKLRPLGANDYFYADDLFVALIEADEWMKQRGM